MRPEPFSSPCVAITSDLSRSAYDTARQHLQSITHPRLLVIGDVILDRYSGGVATRISPEAPVPVFEMQSQEDRLGGAASVAGLASALDAEVVLAGLVGDDPEGDVVGLLCDRAGIDRRCVLRDPQRPTTLKQRFSVHPAGRAPHPLLRVDRELRDFPGESLQQRLCQAVVACLDGCNAVLVSDYAKGVCTPQLLGEVMAAANQRGLPVLVDPARIRDYTRYRHASLVVPNRMETELATGRNIRSLDDALAAGLHLRELCDARDAIVKLDADGMLLVGEDGHCHIPSCSREVYDVTGAGDMVLAMLGLAIGAGVPLSSAGRLAAVAAGLEVRRWGVATIARRELFDELANLYTVNGQERAIPDGKTVHMRPFTV